MNKKKHYLPTKETDRITWLNNFALKLATYQMQFNLTPAQVGWVQAAALFYAYIIGRIDSAKQEVTSLVAFKSKLSFTSDSEPLGPVPQPELPTEPAAVPAGIFTTVARMVADIKNSANYTASIGEDLRIIGEETTTQDPALLKPALKVILGTGGHPQLSWVKKGADLTNVYVDRGAGFTLLRSVTGNKLTDNYLLPSATTTAPPTTPATPADTNGSGNATAATAAAAVWRYRIVYVKDDAETGQYSDPISVAVGQL